MQSSSLSNGASCWMQGYQRLHARAIEEFQPKPWKETLPGTLFFDLSRRAILLGSAPAKTWLPRHGWQDMAGKTSLVY